MGFGCPGAPQGPGQLDIGPYHLATVRHGMGEEALLRSNFFLVKTGWQIRRVILHAWLMNLVSGILKESYKDLYSFAAYFAVHVSGFVIEEFTMLIPQLSWVQLE